MASRAWRWAACCCCAGLLGCPARPRAAARTGCGSLLDALVVAAALWFVGWVLISEPTRLLGDATPAGWPWCSAAAVTAAVAVGLTVVVGVRRRDARGASWSRRDPA